MPDKPTILVVDDDEPIVLLMRSLLREYGYTPVTAMSGKDAVAAARTHRPALVLLDKNMPGMNGAEVVRALRGEPELAGLPILILSGERMSRDEVVDMQADGAVLKPFDITDLIEQIRKHVGGKDVRMLDG